MATDHVDLQDSSTSIIGKVADNLVELDSIATAKAKDVWPKGGVLGVNSSVHVENRAGVLEDDGLVGERWTFCGVLEYTSAIFKIKDAALTNLPAARSIYVLNVVVDNIDQTEGSVVVEVGLNNGTRSQNWITPDKRRTNVGERLLV